MAKLEHLMTFRADLEPPTTVGSGPSGVRQIFDVEALQYGDTYFMTQPRFETGDPRYQWINRIVAVAEGRVLPNAVEYHVYQLVNG